MPESYGALGVKVPKGSDRPDVPLAFKDFADSFGEDVGEGNLLIAQDTGSAVFKAMKGDATLATNGTLTVSRGFVQGKRVTLTGVIGSGTETNVTWSTEFADTNYTVSVLCSTGSSTFTVASKSKTGVVIKNNTTLTGGGELHVIAVHD